ncbi:unknown [Akkermansia sp. CAG:344]|nr:unknown [Akkermansia sp. CAG:344]
MRRPEKTLLLFTRIGESLFAAQQPSKKRREKTYPHGLKKKRPPGIEGPRPSSRSRRIPSPPPLPPTARRAFPGQPFHRLRQPCCAIAAQHDVNILESANQIDHFPPGQGPTRRHAEMSAARQRPSLVNHALPLPVQKWAASVRRQLHAHASGGAPRLPGHPRLPQRHMRRLSCQPEPAAVRHTRAGTLRPGSPESAFIQKAPYFHQHFSGGNSSLRSSMTALPRRHDCGG